MRLAPPDIFTVVVVTFTTCEDGVIQVFYQMYNVTSASTSWFVMGGILIAITVILLFEKRVLQPIRDGNVLLKFLV